ncbi:MAG: hypothetical protein M3151_06965 [Actinomycetota bacterium]|nr:hypothetical protein [Actinomycetota bacterium]
MSQGYILPWSRRAIASVALLLGVALLLTSCGSSEGAGFAPACPLGVGRGVWDLGFMDDKGTRPSRIEARKLLESPNFGATPRAAGDLEAGIVDRRLVGALRVLTREHRICVEAFKEGHYFLPGVPDGPRIPEGYGKAGGLPNTHYYGRAADIWWVEGEPVEGNATDPGVLEVGETLAGIPPKRRPDQIIGPPSWTKALGYGRLEGWVSAPDQLELHKDHLHIGYMEEEGTHNAR